MTLMLCAEPARSSDRDARAGGSAPRSSPSGHPARSLDNAPRRLSPWGRAEPGRPLPRLAGRTILVIDDDADALELLRMILESCGARVLAASSTTHARGYLQTSSPELIICDLALPREDGLTFLRDVRARRDTALARVPAIAVTAFYEDYPPATASDFAAYFQKPIDLDALTATIARLLHIPDPDAAH